MARYSSNVGNKLQMMIKIGKVCGFIPWVPEPKNNKKKKNKEGKKVGSGQMVTSIVGIDQ